MKNRLLVTATVAGCLALASPGSAQGNAYFALSQPGAHCKPSNQIRTDRFRYEESSLRNTASNPWRIFVGVCPLSYFVPEADVLELRVVIEDPDEREAWCNLYVGDELDQTTYVTWELGLRDGVGYFSAPPYADVGLLNATVHCLVYSGAAIKAIEIIWVKP
jgi:hypothetical protein